MTAQENRRPRPTTRDTSFQRMLELEKRYKLDRQHRGTTTTDDILSPSSSQQFPSPPPLSPLRPPLQARRRESSSQNQEPHHHQHHHQEDEVMLKGIWRNPSVPSLSISIPPAQGHVKAEAVRGKERAKAELHVKTVTFLAPDDDDLSDQSSICQSPSWEGYGEKKKKKKEEAEQKRREKEKAAKEAKAARKKHTSRLTKEPPAEIQPLADRSLPSPLFANKYSPVDTRSFVVHRVKETRGVDSENSSISSKSSPFKVMNAASESTGFIGGARLEREREVAIHSTVNSTSSIARSPMGRTSSDSTQRALESNMTSPHNLSPLPTPTKRSVQVSYPPTASKTYTLRHTGVPSAHTRSRSQSLLGETASKLQEASRFFKSRDMKSNNVPKQYNGSNSSNGSSDSVNTLQSEPGSRGRRLSFGSYVRHQRTQSNERSISGFMDELKVSNLPALSHSTHGTQKGQSAAKPKQDIRRPVEDRNKYDNPNFTGQSSLAGTEKWPSLEAPIAGSVSEKPEQGVLRPNPQPRRRSFREAAKAVFRRASLSSSTSVVSPYVQRASTDPVPVAAPPISVPQVGRGPSQINDMPASPRRFLLVEKHNESEITVQPEQEKSDSSDTKGSAASSSSSYDSSSPSSPVTTPDSSRPQSQRGVPTGCDNANLSPSRPMIPDGEEMALRLSPQAFRFDDRPSSNRSSRPISGDHSSGHGDKHSRDGQDVKARRDKQSDLDDDWSRTALPIDLDAQSFMTSLTTIDVVDSKGDLIPQPLEINSPKHSNDTFHGPLRLPQSSSAPESSSRVHSTSPAPSIPEPIPPKSIARNYLGLLATDLLAPDVTPPPTKPKAPRAASIPGENGANHAASYLQEARKAVTTSPRPAAAGSAAPSGQQQQQLRGISSPNLPISKAPALNASSRDLRGGAPIAKVLVECCSCKFFQDMPSRVYECMARPDAVVEDSRLGVSGAITTCVRCPWCGHNMSTKCCAGYAAVVYLKEKLHGA